MTKLELECLFAEVMAEDEAGVREIVERALGELREAYGEGWRIERVLEDPMPGRFGVEVTEVTEGGQPGKAPALAWARAHALATILGEEARVEPCLAGEVEIDIVHESAGSRGDPPRDVRWHHLAVGVSGAHAALRAMGVEPGQGVVIGHPDTGYTRHAEIWREDGESPVDPARGANLLEHGQPPEDPRTAGPFRQPGHGTQTASVMVARAEVKVPRARDGELVDLLGIAPAATVVPIRVTETVIVLGWQRRLARAIELAVEAGCHVISMSLGGLGGSRLARAIRHAEARGVILVAAAGNYVPFVVAPANDPRVVACAASNSLDRPWSYSASGPAVDITAPGEDVWVATWDGARAVADASSGTSHATAAVAAAAALWQCAHRQALATVPQARHPAIFRHALRATAQRRPGLPIRGFGAGLLDCSALVEHAPDLRAADDDEIVGFDASASILADLLAAAASMAEHGPSPSRSVASVDGLHPAVRAELASLLIVDAAARGAWTRGDDRLPSESEASPRLRAALRTSGSASLPPSPGPTEGRELLSVAAPVASSATGVVTVHRIAIELELDIEIHVVAPEPRS